MDEDITTTVFKIVKNAEPPILLASISLAISALVFSRNEYLQIFNYSIISSFMFIFSFIFYVGYEVYKKFMINEDKRPDIYTKMSYDNYDSNIVFVKNSLQIASLFYFIIGIIFFVLIAYEFGSNTSDIAESKVENSNNHPIPILPIVQLFFIIYYPSFITFYFFKNLKTNRKNVNSWVVIVAIIVLSYFVPSILNSLYEMMGKTPIFNSLIMSILFLPFVIYGLVAYLRDIKSISKKYRIIPIVIFIIFLYGILSFMLSSIFVKLGVIDKDFSLEKYIINATNEHFNKLNEKIINQNLLLYYVTEP